MHTLECTEAAGQVAVEPEACTCSASNSTDAPMLGVRAALVESARTGILPAGSETPKLGRIAPKWLGRALLCPTDRSERSWPLLCKLFATSTPVEQPPKAHHRSQGQGRPARVLDPSFLLCRGLSTTCRVESRPKNGRHVAPFARIWLRSELEISPSTLELEV